MFFSLVTFIISIILAFTLYNAVGDYVLKTETGSQIKSEIAYSSEEIFNQNLESIPYLSSLTKVIFGKNGILDFEFFSDKLAEKTVKTLITVPVIIIIFFTFHLVSFIFKKIANVVNELPVIGSVDRLLGMICGVLKGLISAGVLFIALFFLQFIPYFDILHEHFNSSVIILLINDFIF